MEISLPSLQTRLELEKNTLVRVMGPAKVSVIDGYIRILGLNIGKGEAIVISRYKSYCIKTLTDSILSISLGEGGSIEKPKLDEEVIDIWETTARNIVKRNGVVVIIGAVESGKTSFSILLSNIALELGIKPCIIDADVGQGDLAPPTFIGMKCMDKKVLWLREEKCNAMRFIGYLSPSTPTAMARIVTSILELAVEAKNIGGELVIINTDGWLSDSSSVEYKYTLIKTLKPNSIVVLTQEFCETFKSLFKYPGIEIHCLPKPKIVRERSKEDRKDLRKYNYKSWLTMARRICFDINSIAISGLCTFNGTPLSDTEILGLKKVLGVEILYASRYADIDIIVVPDNISIPRENIERLNLGRKIVVVRSSNAKGLIAAITDKNLREQSIAIVDEVDFVMKKICVLTDYEHLNNIGGIIVSKIKIDEQWDDSMRFGKCVV